MAENEAMLFFSGESLRKTADGCENLSVAIPATIDEIESLMASGQKDEK